MPPRHSRPWPENCAYFYTAGSGTERLRIDSSGNVGIGTDAPATKLHVVGTGRFDGQLNMSSNRIINVAAPTANSDAANKTYVDSLGGRSCANGQVLKWQDGSWNCAADNSGGGADNLGNHIATTTLRGDTHNTHDLGTSAIRWRNGYFSANVNVTGATAYAVSGATTSTSHAGILGQATASSGSAAGVWGLSSSSAGYGIRGQATSSTGATYGVHGQVNSTTGRAVYGVADAATGINYGGYFLSSSTSGRAVYGRATASAGVNYGGYFRTDSADGYGIYSNGRAHVQGNLTVSGNVTASAYYQSSDRNLKADIERISDPFALLDSIEGKHFVWKDSRKPAYGVIAQDVAAVMPDAVGENDDGYKTVEYGQLIAPLIEAVKQLKADNDNLQRAMRDLRADNDNLREEIRALTKGVQ